MFKVPLWKELFAPSDSNIKSSSEAQTSANTCDDNKNGNNSNLKQLVANDSVEYTNKEIVSNKNLSKPRLTPEEFNELQTLIKAQKLAKKRKETEDNHNPTVAKKRGRRLSHTAAAETSSNNKTIQLSTSVVVPTTTTAISQIVSIAAPVTTSGSGNEDNTTITSATLSSSSTTTLPPSLPSSEDVPTTNNLQQNHPLETSTSSSSRPSANSKNDLPFDINAFSMKFRVNKNEEFIVCKEFPKRFLLNKHFFVVPTSTTSEDDDDDKSISLSSAVRGECNKIWIVCKMYKVIDPQNYQLQELVTSGDEMANITKRFPIVKLTPDTFQNKHWYLLCKNNR